MISRLAECIARGEDFGRCLERVLAEKGLKPVEFAKKAGIPQSTLYKILRGYKPRYGTLVKIFSALREEKGFVALIAARYVLEDKRFDERVRVYPATTLEDAIVAAVRAEKDGARAIICAPVISSLVEKIVDVPVITIKPEKSVERAVKMAIEKFNL
ncbi:MAG: helix-turn-helix domain-containing protein [Archaeoglobus sp.]|uniref:helix-turn-helix domain-containing protein n=1 Tax=Archaeoglobus sp. TaxID=1872626 RepID=UPI001DC8652E|nr:helix-turn-helix domain-containing protein [Archaeoglobus sp.]MBO8179447.1 helix-turn-helix domain-containing protein [Archaeoglobus sp.]